MTYRHTGNFTENSQKRQVVSQTLEMQENGVGTAENSPNQVDFDTAGAGYLYKAHEHQPLGAGQSGTLPIFVGTIPDLTLTINVAMTPVDYSAYWVGDITLYGMTLVPTGLSFDTATGILSGTPTTLSGTTPIIDGDGVNSNAFTITVVSA